ncbi:hypothetical protein [Methylophilus methylotrophus]|uniref:hypothetical protein n=1 Tax=Methylophilus methylotrophus TaxID=17 RepID=UPI0012B5BF58|nr:hypothetical protein [Methylophilus methylotrophus]
MKWIVGIAKIFATCFLAILCTASVEYISTNLLLNAIYPNQPLPENDLGVGFAILPLAIVVFILVFPLSIYICWKITTVVVNKLQHVHAKQA